MDKVAGESYWESFVALSCSFFGGGFDEDSMKTVMTGTGLASGQTCVSKGTYSCLYIRRYHDGARKCPLLLFPVFFPQHERSIAHQGQTSQTSTTGTSRYCTVRLAVKRRPLSAVPLLPNVEITRVHHPARIKPKTTSC